MPCEIRQYCRPLHDSQPALVVIDEHRDSAVGPESCEPRLFLDILSNIYSLVCVVGLAVDFLQFFEYNLSFVTCIYLSAISVRAYFRRQLPFGVPNERSSNPLLAINPLGLDMFEDVSMVPLDFGGTADVT